MIFAKRYFLIFSFIFIQLAFTSQAAAEDKGWFATFKDNVSETWQQPEHYDLYVPAITWHARFAYDKEKTDRYNERPWGAGFGQSRWDDKGNWHGLYIMAFKDSYNKWEPIGGYGWEKPGDRWLMKTSIQVSALPPVSPRVITGTTFRYRCCYRWHQLVMVRQRFR